jgi:hypothetical protein
MDKKKQADTALNANIEARTTSGRAAQKLVNSG